MPFTYEQREKITSHMSGRRNECPVCGTNRWDLFDDLIASMCIDVEYKRPIEGKLLPTVALICGECGYVRQVAAGKVGLLR